MDSLEGVCYTEYITHKRVLRSDNRREADEKVNKSLLKARQADKRSRVIQNRQRSKLGKTRFSMDKQQLWSK